MNKRVLIFLLAAFLAIFPTVGLAQMHGGNGGMHGNNGNNGGMETGNGPFGMMSGVMEGMGVMMGHDLTIGADGTAYILDPDWTVLTAPKTTIIAVSPKSGKASEWKASVAGLVHEVGAGVDKVVVSAVTEGMMGFGNFGPGNQGMHGSNPAATTPLKSKLYFLNSADGTEARSPIDHDGMATSLTVRKVDTTEYLYLVTRDFGAMLGSAPNVRLTIYKMDGSKVKAVDLSADVVLEQE